MRRHLCKSKEHKRLISEIKVEVNIGLEPTRPDPKPTYPETEILNINRTPTRNYLGLLRSVSVGCLVFLCPGPSPDPSPDMVENPNRVLTRSGQLVSVSVSNDRFQSGVRTWSILLSVR